MTTTDGAASITHHGQPAGGSAQAADALPADDPVSVEVTATQNPTTAACLAVAFTAADLHPFAELQRGGITFRHG